MIVEQAFVALPELLLGNHYAVQDYEAGLVGLFSMSILQELNGRNVPHPIKHLQAERRYDPAFSRRADLYINNRRLFVSNEKLAKYGWRHYNWVEAKFFRNKSSGHRHATNKATHQGQLIADMIRLTCLVPLKIGDMDPNGRYFLHVYDDDPKYYLPYQDRPWVENLHRAGPQNLLINNLAGESNTAKVQFGHSFNGLQIQATVTNHVNFPITYANRERLYWCVLTRFDAFSVILDDHSYEVHANGVTKESQNGVFSKISKYVGEHLGSTKPSETLS